MTSAEFAATVRYAVACELRRLRHRAGLTQGQLAAMLDSHRPIISRAERGKHSVTLPIAAAFAHACGGGLGHVLVAIDQALGMLPKPKETTP